MSYPRQGALGFPFLGLLPRNSGFRIPGMLLKLRPFIKHLYLSQINQTNSFYFLKPLLQSSNDFPLSSNSWGLYFNFWNNNHIYLAKETYNWIIGL